MRDIKIAHNANANPAYSLPHVIQPPPCQLPAPESPDMQLSPPAPRTIRPPDNLTKATCRIEPTPANIHSNTIIQEHNHSRHDRVTVRVEGHKLKFIPVVEGGWGGLEGYIGGVGDLQTRTSYGA